MEASWRAVSLSDVSEEALESAFEKLGLKWTSVLHVTATSALAHAMRARGLRALTIQDLIDLVVWTAVPSESMAYTAYPTFEKLDVEVFEDARASWASGVARLTLALGVEAESSIRRCLLREPGQREAKALMHSTSDLCRAFVSLAASGVRPDCLPSASPAADLAVKAWSVVEADVPTLFQTRADLWSEIPDEVTSLRGRIDAVLTHLLGTADDQVDVAYHGFYFFTAPQWAWFQRLRGQSRVTQLFVVHDDGESQRFEIWRQFFVDTLSMPDVQRLPVAVRESVKGGVSLLDDALSGQTVTNIGGERVQVIRYPSPSQFAAAWRYQKTAGAAHGGKAQLFAAGAEDIERMIGRFDSDTIDESVSLMELPVGQFLLALHDSLQTDGEALSVKLSSGRLLDMVSSGMLDAAAGPSEPSQHISAIRKAMPFFDGLVALDDWSTRAAELTDAIARIHRGFPRRGEHTRDIARIDDTVGNPFRLAPWLDLTPNEAAAVAQAVQRVAEIAAQLLAASTVAEYMGEVKKRLEPQLESLPEEIRDQIGKKLSPLFEVDREGTLGVDVAAIKSAVEIVLGRRVGFEQLRHQDTHAMRNLDALAFAAPSGQVHVANLSDRAFPAAFEAIPWPFDLPSVLGSEGVPSAARDILALRDSTSSLGDLYLFGLALGTAHSGVELVLSWMAEVGPERLNPSPLLALVMDPGVRAAFPELRSMLGGVRVEDGDPSMAGFPALPPVLPRGWTRDDAAIAEAIDRLNQTALSSAFACSRRFALQWALGSSAAYGGEHQHAMLFGNLDAALQSDDTPWKMSAGRARDLVTLGWRQMTRGQRESSIYKRAVQPPGKRSADWRWIFTLAGQNPGTDRVSAAYRAAADGRRLPGPELVAPADGLHIPLADPRLQLSDCEACPVRSRCGIAIYPERR